MPSQKGRTLRENSPPLKETQVIKGGQTKEIGGHEGKDRRQKGRRGEGI